jgi:hypothetical protein
VYFLYVMSRTLSQILFSINIINTDVCNRGAVCCLEVETAF